jgi:hypothetical protein
VAVDVGVATAAAIFENDSGAKNDDGRPRRRHPPPLSTPTKAPFAATVASTAKNEEMTNMKRQLCGEGTVRLLPLIINIVLDYYLSVSDRIAPCMHMHHASCIVAVDDAAAAPVAGKFQRESNIVLAGKLRARREGFGAPHHCHVEVMCDFPPNIPLNFSKQNAYRVDRLLPPFHCLCLALISADLFSGGKCPL